MADSNSAVTGPASAVPLFSVVIPTYNRAAIIGKAVESVLAQTCRDFEIVVVDNGGSDNTKQVLEQYRNPSIRYHWQRGTGGPAGPRNTGIRLARGTYVAFLDSDDWWYPEKLAKVKQALDAHPGAALIHHPVDVIMRSTMKPVYTTKAKGPAVFSAYEDLLIEDNYIATSSAVVLRSAVLDLGGFREDDLLVAVEDFDLWLRLARQGYAFVPIPERLGALSQWEGNLSSLESPKRMARLEYLVSQHLPHLPPYSPARKGAEGNLSFQRARFFHSQGKFMAAIAQYLKCLPGVVPVCKAKALAGILLCLARIRR